MKAKLILLNLCLLLTVLLLPSAARAADGTPVWTNYFNGSADKGDYADAIAVDTIGNAYVTGTSSAANDTPDILTMKFSADGQPAWTNIFDGAGNSYDQGNAIALDPHGNVYVAGTTTATNLYYDFVTIKFSNDGVPLWTNYFNGPGDEDDELYSMAVDGSGNVYVTGYMTDSTGGYTYATIKYSTAGVPLWTNVFTDPAGDSATAEAIALDSATNVYVTGYSYSPTTKYDYVTIKYSTDGVSLWTNIFNGPSTNSDYAAALAVDGDGNAVVTGYTLTASGFDYATIKYSTAGTPLWTNYYNGTANGDDHPSAVALNSGGDVFVTGGTASVGAGQDGVTIKYASDGTPAWTNLFNGTANSSDSEVAVAVDPDGNALVTGSTTSAGSGYDILTIKYAGDGTPVWTSLLSSAGAGSDKASAIAVDTNGNAYVAGFVATGNNDLAVVKYSGPGPAELNILTGDGNFGFFGSQFQFTLTGPAGSNAVISASTNLIDWTSIATNPLTSGSISFTDSLATNFLQRFYRAQLK